jgi:hypothetical protein
MCRLAITIGMVSDHVKSLVGQAFKRVEISEDSHRENWLKTVMPVSIFGAEVHV